MRSEVGGAGKTSSRFVLIVTEETLAFFRQHRSHSGKRYFPCYV
jgi:hypothetical protein